MPGMYPLVVGTIKQDGTVVQVLIFPTGLVVSTDMRQRCGTYSLVEPHHIPNVADRLFEAVHRSFLA